MKSLSSEGSKGVNKRLPFHVCFLVALCLFCFSPAKAFATTIISAFTYEHPTTHAMQTYSLHTAPYTYNLVLLRNDGAVVTYSSTMPFKTGLEGGYLSLFIAGNWKDSATTTTDYFNPTVNTKDNLYASASRYLTYPPSGQTHEVIYSSHTIFAKDSTTYYEPPFIGDSNFKDYKTGSYTGLLITNPYNDTSSNIPLTNVVAHARIPISTILNTKIYPYASILGNYRTVRQEICDFATENLEFYVNNSIYEIEPIITFDDIKDDNFYNLTITFSFMLSDPNSSVLLKSIFKTGTGVDGLTGSVTVPYSSTINLAYVKFVPVVTTVVDGNTTTTTTTQPTGSPIIETLVINVDGSQVTTVTKDGFTETETVDPNGNVTKTSDKPSTVDPIDSSSPSGFFGSIVTLFGNVFKILLLPLNLVVNIINTLITSLAGLMTNMGQVVPFLSGVFGFLPTPIVALITGCFSFLAIGVFLRMFGRK